MKLEKATTIFQILSHPVRLQILDELRKREACVCHLQTLTQRPQAYISQQLRVLRDANVVIDEKDGQNVFYHLRNEAVRALLSESLGEPGLPKTLKGCTCPHCSGERS